MNQSALEDAPIEIGSDSSDGEGSDDLPDLGTIINNNNKPPAMNDKSSSASSRLLTVHNISSDSDSDESFFAKPLFERLGRPSNSNSDNGCKNSPCKTNLNLSQSSISSEHPSTQSIFAYNSDSLDTLPSPAKQRKVTGSHLTKAERDAERLRKKEEKEKLKRRKEEERMKARQEKMEKKQQQEFERMKKRTLQEAQRTAKPGECMKAMMVMLAPGTLTPPMGGAILDVLQKADIKYAVQPQALENIVTFWREVTDVKEVEPMQLTTEKHEVMEKEVLYILDLSQFLSAVQSYHQSCAGRSGFNTGPSMTLTQLYKQASDVLPDHKIVFVVMCLEKYFSFYKNSKHRNFKNQATNRSDNRKRKIPAAFAECPEVSQLQVEEALLDLQMECNGVVRTVEEPEQLASLIRQFAKSIAEAPFKIDRLNSGLTAFVESGGSVKVSKEGLGLLSLWRQQIQQFRNVTAEVANAIIAEYPSPRDLFEAYKSCKDCGEAERLLQDIVVRRGAGVMATTRRIGKELSRKIYLLMTSDDPEVVIK